MRYLILISLMALLAACSDSTSSEKSNDPAEAKDQSEASHAPVGDPLHLQDLKTRLKRADGSEGVVLYNLTLYFRHDAPKDSKPVWGSGDRSELLRGPAARVMRGYTIEETQADGFAAKYEAAALRTLNKVTYTQEDTYRIDFAKLRGLSWE